MAVNDFGHPDAALIFMKARKGDICLFLDTVHPERRHEVPKSKDQAVLRFESTFKFIKNTAYFAGLARNQ